MDAQVPLVGLGAITAIGNSVNECLTAFREGRSGVGDITFLNTRYRGSVPVAEVKLSSHALAARAGVHHDTGRSVTMSIIAAQEALNDAGIDHLSSFRVGFVSSNTVGRIDMVDEFFTRFIEDQTKGRLRHVFDHECGGVTQAAADHLGIKDFVTTINTACSSSANAIAYGARLIRNDIIDIVVAGGTDALTKFTLNGVVSLMLTDKNPSKPFDQNRAGLNLGEGAGYVVMVSEKMLAHCRKGPYCTLRGFNNSNDAFHDTSSSSEGTGPYLAMKNALAKANLAPADIDYINLHGTGTENNDITESAALQRLFGDDCPPISSTKSFTGPTLGACGGIEAVFSVLAISEGIIFPNLRFETQMEGSSHIPATTFVSGQTINNVMSNSFGFGGNCTSLIFSKI
ncbi:beta-ketoacyl-[acyl-carrier-protein] synthase family protein [soil metagenome]